MSNNELTLNRLARPAMLAAAVLAMLSLGACNRNAEDRTVGQQVDSAVQSTKQAAHEAKQEVKEATAGISQEAKTAGAEASDKVADAAITASVNADLAKDNDLSALRIDVDTHNGHVTLKGTAPSEAAKERAARMAGNVRGVTSVDNQLIVQR
jgi:osmotically-inducible protein OsmY